MKIIDNFLCDEDFKLIKSVFFHKEFPWYWCDFKVSTNTNLNSLSNHQFVHTFYEFNEKLSGWNIQPLLSNLNVCAIVRVKSNLTVKTEQIVKYGFHTDTDFECKTAIYYVNSNNGFTEFIDGTVVESVENRVVMFNSQIKHTGTSCTNEKRRIVLNLNYF